MKNYKFVTLLMDKHEYPEEAKKVLSDTFDKIIANEKANKILESIKKDYFIKDKNFDKFADKTKALSEEIGVHVYIVNLVILLSCTEALLKKYKEENIDEEIFWDSMIDLKVKMLECKENYDMYGTFVEGWFNGFFEMRRFKVGRFEYDLSDFGCSKFTIAGETIKNDEFCLGMHIPSHCGSLSMDVRLDSYKKAYKFFRKKFGDKKYMYIVCGSWLLYPDNDKILPANSNTVDFLYDFEPLNVTTKYDFGDQWRVFGVQYDDKPVSELPRNTSMQRAFAEWLEKGNKTGSAYSILVFDGEKILTRQK